MWIELSLHCEIGLHPSDIKSGEGRTKEPNVRHRLSYVRPVCDSQRSFLSVPRY